jgi:hypothetical protein
MARIFNIYFLFNDTTYSAMVSVRNTPFYTEYTLSNLDKSLMHYLPGCTILSHSKGHYVFQHATAEYSSALMNAIIHAVSEHMQVMNA